MKAPPSDALGARLVLLYLATTGPSHTRAAPLQPPKLWARLGDQKEHSPKATGLGPAQRCGIVKLYMVHATGATLLQRTDKHLVDLSPERFYMTALQHIAAAREMRSSIDLGMLCKSHEQGLVVAAIQARRRLFWTVYSLERVIANVLGRPLSLPGHHIDVHLPDVDDGLQEAILLVPLCRIESRIHHSVYRADKTTGRVRPKLDGLYRQLADWRASIGDSPGRSHGEHLLLHYHRAVCMHSQPFLVLLPVTDPYVERYLAATGSICQAHKRLHQNLQYGHSLIAVQTVIVAGATHLYGLWTQTRRVWNVTRADGLRACSLAFFVMSERAAWVRKAETEHTDRPPPPRRSHRPSYKSRFAAAFTAGKVGPLCPGPRAKRKRIFRGKSVATKLSKG